MSRRVVQVGLQSAHRRCVDRRCLATSAQQLHQEKLLGRKNFEDQRQLLLIEAKSLTLSLYRLIVRSVRTIRQGNENDEKEFKAREEKRLTDQFNPDRDVRLSMISLLPPVDREDELRSRADYYLQYARENLCQESDCLTHPDWVEEQVRRYIYHLKKGNEHRQWLLSDMRFDDPYDKSFDYKRVDQFERRALDFVERLGIFKAGGEQSIEAKHGEKFTGKHVEEEYDDDDFWDDSDDDDDDDDDTLQPAWYKNPRNM